jgi:KUP system potassium uptake protein
VSSAIHLLVHRYALIVLHADDNGNGGTFALYSLLRRQGERGINGPALPSELELSHYGPGSFAKARAQNAFGDWRQKIVTNPKLQKVVRVLVVIGVGAILGDGVLTPAISGVFLRSLLFRCPLSSFLAPSGCLCDGKAI